MLQRLASAHLQPRICSGVTRQSVRRAKVSSCGPEWPFQVYRSARREVDTPSSFPRDPARGEEGLIYGAHRYYAPPVCRK